MKILKSNQRCYWCSFCPVKTTKATHRATGGFSTFACKDHISDLKKFEQDKAESESHLTEADHQTWMRL